LPFLFGGFSIMSHFILHTRNSELNFRSLGEPKHRRSAAESLRSELSNQFRLPFFWLVLYSASLHTTHSELCTQLSFPWEPKQRRSTAFSFADLVWRLWVAFFFVEI
jgi:hypothetical protein